MMNVLLTTFAPYIHALGWSLLHFLWQGALIGLAYALLRGRCSTSHGRHGFGMFCLTAMLACPVLTFALLWPSPGDPAFAVTSVEPLASAAPPVSVQPGAVVDFEFLLPWCVGVWLAGVSLIGLRSFLHWRRLTAIVSSAVAMPRDWQLRLIDLSMRFGIPRPIRLLSSFEVSAPTLVGWLKPVILLPASLLSGFTPSQIELILAHELAHVRRYDYLANLVQIVVETLLFYHPAVHWICSDVRQQREQCCDDMVLSVGGGERVAYARTLADLEEWVQDGSGRGLGTLQPALGADGGVLFTRVRRIVEPGEAEYALQSRGGGMFLPLALLCTGFLLVVLRLNSWTGESVGVMLARASATSAELLAAATFRIHPDASALPLRIEPAAVVLRTPSAVESEIAPPPALPKSEFKLAAEVALPAAELSSREKYPITAPAKPITEAQSVPPLSQAAPTDSLKKAAPAISNPRPVHIVQPSYPSGALRSGVTGRVDLEFRVDADGNVRDIRVLDAQPAGVFDRAAIVALQQWQFEVPAASAGERYVRSFAFTAGSAPAACREVTGSHICRRQNHESRIN
ncbi:M56 family metallopeptidase [Rudaea sp. 3F27F6]|uniref:M56 family metallopeptidase n=2 Tax=unclassified Rudaea TaxID=2627037 RepID=UPI0010F96514|nr:M56 family metallopeptidase [Rudaea sp. 3F27F6]